MFSGVFCSVQNNDDSVKELRSKKTPRNQIFGKMFIWMLFFKISSKIKKIE